MATPSVYTSVLPASPVWFCFSVSIVYTYLLYNSLKYSTLIHLFL